MYKFKHFKYQDPLSYMASVVVFALASNRSYEDS